MTVVDTQYLLDTNILVHYVRQGETWARIRAAYNLFVVTPRPRFCIVSAGELRSLALQRSWGPTKIDRVDYCLAYFARVALDEPGVIERYAQIDATGRRDGWRMGKNDLWIAAAAAATRTTLLTTDGDFDWLDPLFLARHRVAPLAG